MQGEEAIVKCGTSKGPIVMQLHRDWSPNGYDRATELFEKGFYDGSHFYRAVPGFLVQFGITYSQDDNLRSFMQKAIPDDPQLEPRIPFGLGTVSFAGSGPNSRKTQLFISYKETSKKLGTEPWETPLGTIISGMEHALQFYGGYGDRSGPSQGEIKKQGVEYVHKNFPLTDRFEACTVERIIGGKNQHESFLSNQASSSSSIRRIHDPIKETDDGSSTISAALMAYSSANTRLSVGALVLTVVVIVFLFGLVAVVRSRRKRLNKTS